MAMSDQDFEAVLNKLGLAQRNYSSPDQHETDATPAATSQNASMPAAGTPPAEAAESMQSAPKPGFDGSPEANPSIPTPADVTDQTQQANAAIGASSQPAPGQGQSATPDTSNLGTLPSFNGSFNKSGQPAPSATSQSPDQNPELNDDALKRAQQSSKNRSLITGLGEAAGTFASEASGKKFDPSFYQDQQKMADQPVKDIETRRNAMLNNTKVVDSILNNQLKGLSLQQQQQANDPNSDISKTARGIIKMLHPGQNGQPGIDQTPGFDQLSAQDLKEFTQHILETQAKVDASKAARDTANELKKSALESRNSAQETKQDQQTNKDFMKFSDRVQGSIASSRGDFGKNSNVIRQAGGIEQLINQIKEQPGGADSRQYFELARSLDGMLSSGQGTITGTKELLPHTAAKSFANLEEYLSSKPTAAGLGDFVKRAEDTVKREKKYAVQRNADTVAKMAPGYSHLKSADVDRWNAVLNSQGLDTDDEGNITGVRETPSVGQQPGAPSAPTQQAQSAGQPSFGKDVLDYAKSHNITPEQANQIKLQRTSGAQ